MRVKRGVKARRRRNRVLELAKGFRGRSKNTIRQAHGRVEKALSYAYRDRRTKKRDIRRLWVQRVAAGAREHGMSYSKFMHGLKVAGVELDRKMLAELGARHPVEFEQLAKTARESLS